MTITPEQIESLSNFRNRKKFNDSEWNKRGLNPSNSEKVDQMNELLNRCLDELLATVDTRTIEKTVTNILVKGLRRFKNSYYGREEKEFICDEFQKIASILKVDIGNSLNEFLYGFFLGTIMKFTKTKEAVVETKPQCCTKCQATLTLKVTAMREGVPNYWIIGKCRTCGEFNLFSTGLNAGGLKFENFDSAELLNGNEHSEDQAKIRLEQIKYFRGNK